MAFASDSTPAPARPLLPLPAFDRRAIGRDGWARARAMAARLGGAVRGHLAEGLRQAWAAARGLLPAEGTAPTANEASQLASESVSESTAPLLLLPAPLPPLAAALSRRRAIFGGVTVDEPDTAAEARALHLRRRLEAAAEHGAHLLSALGLPQLAALDNAIATLDALDGDTDLEPEPGYDQPEGDDERCGSDQVEDEDSLGWGAGVSQLHLHVEGWPYGECETTAPERHGRGFVRSGPDDAEDDAPCELAA